jgi:peptidoglycan hydrolase-like protein with peptidoglycan-binding domain
MKRSLLSRRRNQVLAVTATAVIVAALLARVLIGSDEATESARGQTTAEVSARDLTATVTLTGRLEHGDTRAIYWQQPAAATTTDSSGTADGGEAQAQPAVADGDTSTHTLTSVATARDELAAGDVMFAVDGRPTVLMDGSDAAYRDLGDDAEDGPDVAQLEQNLTALGYTDGGALVVDEHFGTSTTAAVEDWQEALGVEATGTVELGDVIFLPEPVTVTATNATVGDQVQPGAHLLDVTSDTLVAVGDLPVRSLGDTAEGSAATITLADGTAVPGTVQAIGDQATRPAETPVADSTVELTVQLDATDSPAAVDFADVTLTVTTASRRDVRTVPVAAIVDGGDGKTAVLIPTDSSTAGGDESGDATGDTSDGERLVTLDAGLSAGGYVEILDNSLPEGTSVLLPGMPTDP